jgi:TetR/AcrR family transcriptional repressor of multidrug resistance operon
MRPRDPKKEQLLRKKAMELIVENGFDGFSMHKLARATQMATATIYIYFKDREDLMQQLCSEAANTMAAVTLEGFDPAFSFKKGLRVQWKNRSKFYLENPLLVQFLEMVKHSPYNDKINELKAQQLSAAMHQFVRNAIANKELAKMSLEVYWSVAFAPMYQLIKFHMDGRSLGKRPFQLSEEIMDECLKIVTKALKPS